MVSVAGRLDVQRQRYLDQPWQVGVHAMGLMSAVHLWHYRHSSSVTFFPVLGWLMTKAG